MTGKHDQCLGVSVCIGSITSELPARQSGDNASVRHLKARTACVLSST
jgi:hypothetical protein